MSGFIRRCTSGESKHSLERNSRLVYSLICEGKFKVEELLTHVIDPEAAQSAYDGLTDHKGEYLGVIMDVDVAFRQDY